MKNIFKSKVGAWAVAFLLAVGGVQVKRALTANPYEVAQKQTVLIDTPGGQGSGVVIKRGHRLFVWTANHVVEDVDTVTVKQFVRNEGHRAGSVEFKARLLRRSPEKDLALFWLDAPTEYFRSAEFETDLLEVGTPLLHVGNVLGEQFDSSVSTGVLSQVGVHPDNFPDWPWNGVVLDSTTLSAFYGCSGGPVFKQGNGKVVGILVGSATVGKGYINYVPTREVLDFATRNGVFWAVTGKYCPGDAILESLVTESKVPVEIVPVIELKIVAPQDLNR